MESSRQLDALGPAPGRALIWLGVVLLSSLAAAQNDPVSAAQQLAAAERWQEVVALAQGTPAPPAELNYYQGIALARLGRWDHARQALLNGHRQQPHDKRFPIELAAVEFKQQHNPAATKWLHRALRLDPRDTYASDFLATVYFLQGNLEAALKYWNRVGKPQIQNVRSEPEPRIQPALLDSAFALAPASRLRLHDLLTTKRRLRGLEIFPSYGLDLVAREDGNFDLAFRAVERNGWGRNKWEGLLSLFRGVFHQTLHPELYNLKRSAVNVVSLVRWDAQKRRLAASVSAPMHNNARWRYRLGVDLRNENWEMRSSSFPGVLNLRRQALSADISSFASGKWSWSSGAELSHRDFRGVTGAAFAPALLPQGWQLKHLAEMNYELLRVPERRFVTVAAATSQIGRTWSQPGDVFAKLQGSLAAHWLPQARGDDYEMEARLRAGKTFGDTPFDELYMLGLERDNDLPLRAHIGTRHGRKGSAPLGRNYLLANWELDKSVYKNGFITVKVGPFLDTGKITGYAFSAPHWLWDTGLQAKLRALSVEVVFSYGKDLRSGRNAFYVTVGR